MAQHLFDAFSPVWSAPATDSPVEVATNLDVGQTGQVTTLDWYRASTASGIVPNRLRLYDAGTGQVVAELTVLADSGAVGWQRTDLVTPATVYAGRAYKVAAQWTGTSHHTSWGVAIQSQGNYPLTVANPERSYHYAGLVTSGATSDNGAVFGVDVTYAPGSLPAPGAPTTGDVEAALSDWLTSTGDNTHPTESTPYLTYKAATGATGFDAIKAVADTVAAAVSGLPGTIAGAVTTVTGQITTMTATVTGQLTTLAAALAGDVTNLSARILELYAGLLGGVPGALSGRTAFPTELWTLVGEGDFDGEVAITVAADLYALSFDTGTSGLVATPVAGVNWYPRAGWWCLLNGTFAAERHYFDFANVHLTDQGRRMPGALIHCRAGCSGHWQAWALT